MTDNIFELFRKPSDELQGDGHKVQYFPCTRDHGETHYNAVHAYFADHRSVLLYYAQISGLIAPDATRLYIITPAFGVRVTGRDVNDLITPLQYQNISGFGCWNAKDFLPVEDDAMMVIYQIECLPLDTIWREPGVLATRPTE